MRNTKKSSKLLLTKTLSKINEAFDEIKSDLYLSKEKETPAGTTAFSFEELFLDQTRYFGKVLAILTESVEADPKTEGTTALMVSVNSCAGGTWTEPRTIVLTPTANQAGEVTVTVVGQEGNAGPGTLICTESIYGLEGFARYILEEADCITDITAISPAGKTCLLSCTGPTSDACIHINKHYGAFDVSKDAEFTIATTTGRFMESPGESSQVKEPLPAGEPVPVFQEGIVRPARRGFLAEQMFLGKVSRKEVEETKKIFESRERLSNRADKLNEKKFLAE